LKTRGALALRGFFLRTLVASTLLGVSLFSVCSYNRACREPATNDCPVLARHSAISPGDVCRPSTRHR